MDGLISVVVGTGTRVPAVGACTPSGSIRGSSRSSAKGENPGRPGRRVGGTESALTVSAAQIVHQARVAGLVKNREGGSSCRD